MHKPIISIHNAAQTAWNQNADAWRNAIARSGYQITEQLYAGSRTLVYRAIRDSDSNPVILKLLRNEMPTFSELVQFRNQYAIIRGITDRNASNVTLPGIVQAYSLEPCQNAYLLVMEDFGGISLSQFTQGNPLEIATFSTIAIQLTDILHYLYQHRVIHKDIKPANILIHPETKQVKLIDFSIASLLPRETQEIQNPNVLEGTLAYLSPEQTGRMNRAIDYRSDFYALGVTFYQVLAGKLPFVSDDPMELVHCHLAVSAIPVHRVNPKVPAALSQIVAKLMAKNAEDRYQSAIGLKRDLELCLQQWNQTGTIAQFPIAQQDRCDRFTIPEKLYGRETEIAALLSAFDRVANGSSELMLVAGFSGIGKTAAVNEVHKPIVRLRGYFIKGKYDQFQRNIPFSAFVQSFRDLMAQLLGKSQVQLQHWRTKILQAVGENGQVIIDVIPELKRIIGKQPPVPELSGNAAQNRFNLLFQSFIQVFTVKEHPLVIFLDDLQWADSASLNLLKLLLSETETGYLLLLGAYRDNEVFPAHPLMLALEEIKKSAATVNTITLEPLNQADLNLLVADTLNCSTELALPLTNLIYQKTKGNPFFATQFLKALHGDRLITFNLQAHHWECDIAQVKAAALTSDVVEFMAAQLQKLPVETQAMLKLAACIGNSFDLTTLAIISQKLPVNAAADLWPSLQSGLIMPITETYKFFQNNHAISTEDISVPYNFLHDRVQQAAYSLIPEDQKQATHLQIGQILLCNTPIECREEKLFAIVNQLNHGINLLVGATQTNELAQLNGQAARKAKHSTAYAAAWRYLNVGINLLESDCWQENYSLSLDFYLEATEVAYLMGDVARLEQFALVVEENAKTFLDTIKIYEIKITAFIARSQQQEAINMGLKSLKKLGIILSQVQLSTEIDRAIAVTNSHVTQNAGGVEGLIDRPQMTEPEKIAAMRILSSLVPATFVADPALFPLIVCEQVNLSILYGNNYLAAFAYANYGQILSGLYPDSDSGYQFGKLALSILTKFDNRAIEAKVNCIFGFFIIVWQKHLRESLPILRSGYLSGLETGDLEYGSYCLLHTCENSYLVGQELTSVAREMLAARHALCRIGQENNVNYVEIYRQAVLNLMGDSPNNCQLVGDAYNEHEAFICHQKQNDRYAILNVYLNKMILCYLFEEIQDALTNTLLAQEYLNGVIGTPFVPVFYFYDSLIHLKAAAVMVELERDDVLKRVAKNQSKMKVWADRADTNYLHKYYLVEAELCRILQQKLEAIELYDTAISGAKANEYIQEEALANELAAKFYLDWGKQKVAACYMQEAYYCYARWGAKAKVEDLTARYPQLLTPILFRSLVGARLSPFTTSINTLVSTEQTVSTNSTSSISQLLDLATVIKAAQALSTEIHLERLLATLMQVIVENSGADKAALFL